MLSLHRYLQLLKKAIVAWDQDYAASMGAALAYYTVFSLVPLVVIGVAVAPSVKTARPERELYDLRADPTETNNLLAAEQDPDQAGAMDEVATELAVRLHDWRQRTGDVIPSDFAGTRIATRYAETYLRIHHTTPTSRSVVHRANQALRRAMSMDP